jgi:hypothetical protein
METELSEQVSRLKGRMARIVELFKSHHTQIALATGVSILMLACASRWLLPDPMGYLAQAFPPFIAVIAEGVITKHKDARIATTWYWVAAILLATALMIALHMM